MGDSAGRELGRSVLPWPRGRPDSFPLGSGFVVTSFWELLASTVLSVGIGSVAEDRHPL
jgi:hypothetical protein